MSTARLRAFVAVAKAGSFTEGARILGLTQPTLTTQVQMLEKQYGVELYQRHGRRVRLTELGLKLLPIAERAIYQEEDALALLKDAGQLRGGHLRIGAVGPFHVIGMMQQFSQAYPGIDITLQMGNSATVMASLESGDTDVAVLAGLQRTDACNYHLYAEHPILFFSHIDHPLARQRGIPFHALDAERFIHREPGSTTRTAVEEGFAAAGISPRVVMEIGSREAIREAVKCKLGISAVSAAEFIPDPVLHILDVLNTGLSTQTYVYCLRTRQNASLIRAFRELTMRDDAVQSILSAASS